MSPARSGAARGSSFRPYEAEETRAFLQQRLALLGRTFFCIVLGFDAVAVATETPYIRRDPAQWLSDPGNASLVAGTTLSLGLWVLCRGRPLALVVLRALDLLFVVSLCSVFSLLAFATPRPLGAPGDPPTWAVLALTNGLIARAVVIPSTPWRTLALSLLASVPTVTTSYLSYRARTADPTLPFLLTSWSAAWCLSAAAAATVASRIIYGLRREVREARRLGQYTLEEKIGEGGMGVVYRASHAMLRRPTAVKLLPSDRAGAERAGRFEREVQLTSQLTHPNTVAVFDYGRTVDGVFYYAMEYLEGLNLDELVQLDGAQPAGRVVHVLRQVAGSLAEAHGVGLIHRDIKPANVILVPERGGQPDVAKVVDFGLVKDVGPGSKDLSREDVIAGTPMYLAPEAISTPEEVDARADIYAVGAVGFFLLTGTPVFNGRNAAEVLGHHLHTPAPRPEERLGEETSAPLSSILLSCLEKDPSHRPASAMALIEALDAPGVATEWTPKDARDWWARRVEDLRRRPGPARCLDELSALTVSTPGPVRPR